MEGSFIIMSKNLFYFKKFYEMPLKMKSHILCASVCVCMHMCVSMEGNFIILSKKRFYLNKFYEMPLKIKSHILCASVCVCVFSCVFICTRVCGRIKFVCLHYLSYCGPKRTSKGIKSVSTRTTTYSIHDFVVKSFWMQFKFLYRIF